MLTLNVNDLEASTQDKSATTNLRTMIETAKPSAPLEDYIEELKERQTSQPKATESSVDDRERDLILAAELGKALLERNEQLTLANESITEQYSQKLEVGHFLNKFHFTFFVRWIFEGFAKGAHLRWVSDDLLICFEQIQ